MHRLGEGDDQATSPPPPPPKDDDTKDDDDKDENENDDKYDRKEIGGRKIIKAGRMKNMKEGTEHIEYNIFNKMMLKARNLNVDVDEVKPNGRKKRKVKKVVKSIQENESCKKRLIDFFQRGGVRGLE